MKRPGLSSLIAITRLDWPLLTALLLLSGIGLFVLYSAADQNLTMVSKQGVRLGIGFAALLVFSQIPPRLFRLWTPWLFVLGMVLLVGTEFFGVGRGTQRWLDLKLLRFQPSEIMKLSVPMMVAWWLQDKVLPPDMRSNLIVMAIIAVPVVLIARQPDLGTALMVTIAGGFALFLAGLRWRLIGGLALLSAVAAPALWMVMREYQRNRIRTFLDPESDPLGEGWNIIQSKIAAGSGGLTGKGWLQGSQSHLEFLPERSTDFVLAVFAEEFGLLGILVLMTIYLYITGRGLYIAVHARDTFSRLLAGSLSMMFFLYVAVNAGMVSGLLPVVGVPLPLVSYGGTSIVTLLAGFGILMSIYSHRRLID